jgi:hypothetical protein
MKRFWTHVVGAVSLTGGIAVLAPGCAHDDSSFFIDFVLAPPQGAATSGCEFTADPTQPSMPSGLLDVEAISSFNNAYFAEFLMGNQLIQQQNTDLLMTETSRIIIQGAVVTITGADGNPIPGGTSSFTSLTSGEIDPSAGETPGFAATSLEIVDPTTVQALRKSLGAFEEELIVTYVKAFGTTIGGDHVESNTFEFPIYACRGCLISFTSEAVPITLASGMTEAAPTPNCCGMTSTSTTAKTFCFFGQDTGAVDCHDCLGDSFCSCGPTATTAECAAIKTTCGL